MKTKTDDTGASCAAPCSPSERFLTGIAELLREDGFVEIKQIENGLCEWVEINGERGEGESMTDALLSVFGISDLGGVDLIVDKILRLKLRDEDGRALNEEEIRIIFQENSLI